MIAAAPITTDGDTVYDPDTPPPHMSERQDAGMNMPGNPDTSAKEQARNEFKNVASRAGITVEITSIGVPELEPGMTVSLKGMGDVFDNTYGVLEVEHSVGIGGFTTRFKAVSNLFENVPNKKKATGDISPKINSVGDLGSALKGGFVEIVSKIL